MLVVQDDQGRPLKLNKLGQYVVDSGKIARQKKMDAVIDELSVALASTPGAGTVPPVPATPAAHPATTGSGVAERNRALLREKFSNLNLLL